MNYNYKFFMKTLMAFCVLAANVFFSQSTTTTFNLDPTFNMGSGTYAYASVNKQAVQSDGKIIIAGTFNAYGSTLRPGIARINADGTLDTTFNPGTGFVQPSSISAIKIQPDGKILVGGMFTSYNGTSRTNLLRLNTDGTLDTSFNPGTGPMSQPNSIDLQSDGKILIVGAGITKYNGTNVNNVARINTDGTLDTSFVTSAFGGSVSAPTVNVAQLKVQSVGGVEKILVGGTFAFYGSTARNNILRLNLDGSLDSSFDAGNILQGYIVGLDTNASGNVLLLGPTASVNSVLSQPGLVSLTSTGALDTAFNPGGTGAVMNGTSTYPGAFLIKPDGKIFVVGNFNTYNGVTRNGAALLNADGTVDSSFDPGSGTNTTISGAVASADGGFLLSGTFTSYNGTGGIKWYCKTNAAGVLDTSFTANALPFSAFAPNAVVKQSDDKLIIAGNFNVLSGTVKNYLARLNTDGSIDTTFNNGGTGPNGLVQAIFLQSDGKILIGGNFITYNGVSRAGVARLNADGTLDNTFTPGTAFAVMGQQATISSITQLSTGKILIGGYNFTTYNGSTITNKNLIQLNADGTYDSSFNTSGVGVNNALGSAAVNAIKEQADGKILIGGGFASFNGTNANGFVRLNANGSVDTSFTQGWTSGGAGLNTGALIRYILIQPSDNKIIIGGTFTTYNTASRTNIARINTDGTLDTTFNAGSAGIIYQPLMLSDERLVVPGAFTTFNGATMNKLVLLNTDGSVDTSVTPGTTGAMGLFSPSGSSRISFVFKQTDGNFLVLGNFNSYNSTAISIAARLIPVVTNNNLGTNNITTPKLSLYPNPAKDFVNLSNITKGADVSVFDMTGKLLYQTKSTGTVFTLNTYTLKNGIYLLKVDGQTTKLLIAK